MVKSPESVAYYTATHKHEVKDKQAQASVNGPISLDVVKRSGNPKKLAWEFYQKNPLPLGLGAVRGCERSMRYQRISHVSSIVFVFLLFWVMLSFLSCQKTTGFRPSHAPSKQQPLTVMTYNVDIGSDADRLVSATQHLLQLPVEVANIYNNVIASDFPSRAKAMAKIIKKYQPHLIGLQEISRIRRQSPGDLLTGKNTPLPRRWCSTLFRYCCRRLSQRG